MAEAVETKAEEKVLTDQEAVEKYLSDPDVKKNATIQAENILQKCGGNWLSLERIMKKTMFKNVADASQIMRILCLLNLAAVKQEQKGVRYKITLNPADKKILLEEELKQLTASYETKKAALEAAIQKLTDSE